MNLALIRARMISDPETTLLIRNAGYSMQTVFYVGPPARLYIGRIRDRRRAGSTRPYSAGIDYSINPAPPELTILSACWTILLNPAADNHPP